MIEKMAKSIISEGKTTNEAIENGLKELKVSKKNVDIRVIESEEKRSFFSILAPRVVKVELTVKEDSEQVEIKENKEIKPKKEIKLSDEEQEKAKGNLEVFLKGFIANLPETTKYAIEKGENYINVSSSNLVIAIGSDVGTISEISLSLVKSNNKKVILVGALDDANNLFTKLRPNNVFIAKDYNECIDLFDKIKL